MASFVYNSTDALPEYFSSPIIGRKAVASPGGDPVKILEWPADGIVASEPSTEPSISLTLPALAARPIPKLRITWKQGRYALNEDGKVDMVIFSTHSSMQRSFEKLVPNPGWGQALQDPFCLLITVLDDLFRQVDTTIWKVLIVLRSVENVGHSLASHIAGKAYAIQTVLGSAETGAIGASFDFIAMYNIAKHIIHLKESSSAAYLTACEISEAHRQLMIQPERTDRARVMEGVQALIQHKLTLLEGCKVRVESLDNRTQNMTNL
ncbi:MAG: hypothetical protein Q9223_007698, partial [Gallowayella weberi]